MYHTYNTLASTILQIPFVRDLCLKNQELISQLEMLEQPIRLNINEITSPSSLSPPHNSKNVTSSYHGDNIFDVI